MKPGDIIRGEKGAYKLFEELDCRKVFLARTDDDDLYVVKGFAHQDAFETEAGAYRAILEPHQNVVRCEEILNEGYVILDYLPGRTIIETIINDGPIPLEIAMNILRGICAGLAHVHSYGISHGDVRMGNIMLTPRPVLFDLNFSDDDMGKDIRHAAEMLHEMLTGKRPAYDEFFEPICDARLDSDIAHIIKSGCEQGYESIMDLWSDLEEIV